MKFLKKIAAALTFAEQSIVIVLLSLMVILAFSQVVLRNFFSGGILWGDTFLRHMVLWLGFLGAALAAERGKHIGIDVIGRFVSGKTAAAINILTNLFATIVSFFLARAGWTFLLSERETGDILLTIAEQPLPGWWFQLIIPIGFGLISIHFLIRTVEQLVTLIRPSQSSQGKEIV